MSRQRAEVVVLCEDNQTMAFVRRYLKGRRPEWQLIFDPRRFPYHRGKQQGGFGNSHVLKRVVTNVQAHRQRMKHVNKRLLIVIDADSATPDEKIRQLNLQLIKNAVDPIQNNEGIAVLTPKRNIETWIRYGEGDVIDEETAYPHLNKPRKCQTAVTAYLTEICPGGLPADAPSSLHHACDELAKIL